MKNDLFQLNAPNVWTALAESRLPLVLYGMGNAADRVLDILTRRGIRVAGVMASDDFCRYQPFRGFTVKKESDLQRELGDFTVALCFGSSLPDVMAHIREVAGRHPLLVPNIPVVGDELMDDEYLIRHRAEIAEAFSLLADEASRRVFRGVLDFYYTGRLACLSRIESDKDEVFGDILRLHDERYLDLGAYRGDTVDEFLHFTDGYDRIVAVEPNPKNFQKLSNHLAKIEHSTAVNAGIADRVGNMYIAKKAGRMPILTERDGIEIPVTTVDALACSPTYIKVDIEGMEDAMLCGAVRTLREHKPKLNLAAYHRTGDFFSLILRLHSIRPDYKIHLRKHPYIPCWDLNLYAI